MSAMGATPVLQQRSQEKRDRLINALDTLLREKPFDQITISEIASTAGVSPATIYQRFNRKDAAISILIELYLLRVKQWTASEAGMVHLDQAASLYEALMMIGDSAWRQVDAMGYIMRPAYLYSRLKPDLVGPTWNRMQKAAFRGFRSFLARFEDEIKREELDESAATISNFFNLMLLGPLLHSETDLKSLHDGEAFSIELADFAHRYLTSLSQKGRA